MKAPVRRIPTLVLLLFLASAGAAETGFQQKLDPQNDLLAAPYVPQDRVGRYGYQEVEYPKSFKDDGRGSIKTKPPIEDHSQTVPDAVRDWLSNMAPVLDRNPQNKEALGAVVKGLGAHHLCTRIVPFADRFVALGGTLTYEATDAYVGGLARLGRTDEAYKFHDAARAKWGSMAENISSQLFSARFYYSWLVERNFKGMLHAHEQGLRQGLFPGDANLFQEILCDLLRQAAERQELPWFLTRLEKHWIWINDFHLKSAIATVRKAGLPVPESLLTASDVLFGGATVPAEAAFRRAVDSLNRGETEAAVRQAERGVELAKPQARELYFRSLLFFNRILRQREDYERAYEFTQEAERVAKQLNKAPEIGWSLIMKGFLQERLADHRGAATCYAEALRIGQAIDYPELMNTAKSVMARALSYTGMADQVEPTLRSRAEAALEHRVFTNVPGDYMNWGQCLTQMGSHAAALTAYRTALAPVKGAGTGYKPDLNVTATCLKGVAYSLLAQKKYAEADLAYDDYAALAKQSMTAASAWVWQLGKARCRYGLKQNDEAQRWIDECLRSIEVERANLKDFQHRRTLNDNKYEAYELAVQLALERNDPDGAFTTAERSRARTFLDEMGAHSAEGKVAAPRDFRSIVQDAPDPCVVYYQLPDRLLAWVISEGKGELIPLAVRSKELQDGVQEFLNAVYLQSALLKDKVGALKGKVDTIQSAKKLYQSLWAPLAGRLPAGKRVCIVAHRNLHYVPFQALHDGEKFLIESRELYYAPSATALMELKKRRVAEGGGALVFDPILSDDPKSPFAKTESKSLKEQYADGRFVLQKAATVAAFKEAARDSAMIHISSHGYFNPWIPLESGLVFMGPGGSGHGLFRARDIYSMRFDRTRLVVMSACVSSVGDLADGDEVTGLTRAFQVAGVPNVIGSLWPVENEATTELMILFHRKLADAKSPSAALRLAQMEMIRKPAVIARWAAFGVTGIGEEAK